MKTNDFKRIETNTYADFLVHRYTHTTGLSVIHVKNDDKNIVFFPCIPTSSCDNSGLAHIVEHMVLCRSEQFPYDDVFATLLETTYHTYLNAITYQDYTIYPAASLDYDELFHIFKVYIDGLFHPSFLHDPSIFQREKTIVQSEMTGAYEKIEKQIETFVREQLTPSRYDSGGHPENIALATHQNAVSYYETFYRDFCSMTIFFYGDMDIEAHLLYLESVLSDMHSHTASDITADTTRQIQPVLQQTDYIALSFSLGTLDYQHKQALKLLLSHIKQDCTMHTLLLQSDFDIELGIIHEEFDRSQTVILYTKSKHSEQAFADVVLSYLQKLTVSDISAKKFILQMLEEEYGYKPKGLYLGIQALLSPHADFSVFDTQHMADSFKLNYMTLVQHIITSMADTISCMRVYTPKPSATLSPKKPHVSAAANNAATAYEPKNSVHMDIQSISPKKLRPPVACPVTCMKEHILFTKTSTPLCYFDIFLDCACIPLAVSHDVAYLIEYLKKTLCNTFSVSFETFHNTSGVLLSGTCLREDVANHMSILSHVISDVLTRSDSVFTSVSPVDLSQQTKQHIRSSPHTFIKDRSLSHLLLPYAYKERICGYDFYKHAQTCEPNHVFTDFSALFSCEHMYISYASNKEISAFEHFAAQHKKQTSAVPVPIHFTPAVTNKEAFVFSQTNHNVLSYRHSKPPFAFALAKTVLDSVCLWHTVRQNGAYAAHFEYASNYFSYVSYRDSHIESTYRCFENGLSHTIAYLKQQQNWDRMIVSTLGSIDKPKHAKTYPRTALLDFFSHESVLQKQTTREQIVYAEKKDIISQLQNIVEQSLPTSFGTVSSPKSISSSASDMPFDNVIVFN